MTSFLCIYDKISKLKFLRVNCLLVQVLFRECESITCRELERYVNSLNDLGRLHPLPIGFGLDARIVIE